VKKIEHEAAAPRTLSIAACTSIIAVSHADPQRMYPSRNGVR
jgi:hypothetical protein